MKNRLSDGRDGRYPPTNNQLKRYAIPLIVALFSGKLSNALSLSPDAIKSSEADKSRQELQELNAQIVVVQKRQVENVLNADDTYIVTPADIAKSRENFTKTETIVPPDAKETKKKAENILKKIDSLLGSNLPTVKG